MSIEPCVKEKVKEEPRSSFTVDVCIKEETEWGVEADEEPAGELGCLTSNQAGTLHECVKTEPTYDREAAMLAGLFTDHVVEEALVLGPEHEQAPPSCSDGASSGDLSETALLYSHHVVKEELVLGPEDVQTSPSCSDDGDSESVLAGLYTYHVVKEELVLGPECVQRTRGAAAPRERINPRGSSDVSGRTPTRAKPARRRGTQPLLRECSVRLERVERGTRPARARGSDRPDISAYGDSDIEHEIHTAVNKKDRICHLCGRSFALKSQLMKHVKAHIHRGPWICTKTQEESVSDSDEEVDVESLDPPGSLPAAMLLRTNVDLTKRCRSRHKYSERLRRSSLRKLFDELRKQIPATRNNERTAKIAILREAIWLCRRLRKERELKEAKLESLVKQQNKLLAKLKRIRVSQQSITKRPRLAWHGSRSLKLYKSRRQNACPRRKWKMCHVEVVLQKTRLES